MLVLSCAPSVRMCFTISLVVAVELRRTIISWLLQHDICFHKMFQKFNKMFSTIPSIRRQFCWCVKRNRISVVLLALARPLSDVELQLQLPRHRGYLPTCHIQFEGIDACELVAPIRVEAHS